MAQVYLSERGKPLVAFEGRLYAKCSGPKEISGLRINDVQGWRAHFKCKKIGCSGRVSAESTGPIDYNYVNITATTGTSTK